MPAALPSLVGREKEQEQLERLADDAEASSSVAASPTDNSSQTCTAQGREPSRGTQQRSSRTSCSPQDEYALWAMTTSGVFLGRPVRRGTRKRAMTG
ncbi:hypothetical protein ADL02_06910 [Streptomyces sp. NRRL WC-3723]|nr:hypothetical protein ADL02_06910 [Streptomyces sp. NRRL WC-3723]